MVFELDLLNIMSRHANLTRQNKARVIGDDPTTSRVPCPTNPADLLKLTLGTCSCPSGDGLTQGEAGESLRECAAGVLSVHPRRGDT